ncbi:MAG TPA: hypothetical protein VNA20_08750 [Frankiaceae bacterium]|nr:hypothetical protein [Frankiaceae bacterium]
MRRGLFSSALVSGLLLTAAVPFAGTAGAAACPAWTDAAGDASVGGHEELADESVDITAVKVEASSMELRATLTVPKLGNVNNYLPGDRFELAMTAGGTAVALVADRDDVKQGNRVGAVVGSTYTKGGQAVYDITGHRVVITMPYTTLDTALGKPFKGLELKGLTGAVRGAFAPVSMSEALDSAPAPAALTMVGGRVCGDGHWGAATILPVGPGTAISAERPAAGCFGVSDDKGDGRLPNVNPQVPTADPDLDILGVTLRATDRMLYAYLKIDKLENGGPARADGHRFSVDFTFNNHLFSVAASQYKNAQSQQIREGLAGPGLSGKMVQMSLDTPSGTDVAYARANVTPPYVPSDSKAFFDVPNSTVVLGIPIADIQRYGGTRFHGASITGISARATGDFYRNSLIADTAPSTGAQPYSWVAGENKCFSLPTKLTLTTVKAGAVRNVVAKLTTNGVPVVGEAVAFNAGGKRSAIVTDARGVAVLKGVKPGTKVVASFTGVGYRASSATGKA